MVTVKNYAINTNSNNETFISLILESDLEVIKSKQSGNFYFTTKTCRIPSTLDENTAKMMIGKSIQGSIVKEPCEPYDYTVSDTGEVLKLDYKYTYVKEGFVQSNQAQQQANGAALVNQDLVDIPDDVEEY